MPRRRAPIKRLKVTRPPPPASAPLLLRFIYDMAVASRMSLREIALACDVALTTPRQWMQATFSPRADQLEAAINALGFVLVPMPVNAAKLSLRMRQVLTRYEREIEEIRYLLDDAQPFRDDAVRLTKDGYVPVAERTANAEKKP